MSPLGEEKTSMETMAEAVLRLLDADPSWLVVGWRRDDELVACAGLERRSEDELAVRALAADGDASARDLLNAVAAVATGARLVAEVETPRAELYRHCGFDVQRAGASTGMPTRTQHCDLISCA